MKSRYNGSEIVTELTDTDIVDIMSRHEFFDVATYQKTIKAIFCDFQCFPISVRDDVIKFILKKHLKGEALKKVLIALDSADTTPWK